MTPASHILHPALTLLPVNSRTDREQHGQGLSAPPDSDGGGQGPEAAALRGGRGGDVWVRVPQPDDRQAPVPAAAVPEYCQGEAQ